jgi:hypothetical protein
MEKLLVEIPPSSPSPITPQNSSNFPLIGEAFLAAIIFFVSAILIGPISNYLFKNRSYLFNFGSYKKPICHQCNNCQYFESNPYLKCSVHPLTVLTEDAIDCIDYTSPQKTRHLKKHSEVN